MKSVLYGLFLASILISPVAAEPSAAKPETTSGRALTDLPTGKDRTMNLGTFSVSLSVKDIHRSKAFYEALGFVQIAGNIEQRWVILKNGTSKIGLFQGMFENNLLTFNPGWDDDGNPSEEREDIRDIQKRLKGAGIEVGTDLEAGSKGPASFMITDPDGNTVLLDQHL